MKQQMERGGSVIGFIVACLVAAVLLVGGIYVVEHADWFATTETSSTSENSTAEKSSKSDTSDAKNAPKASDKQQTSNKNSPKASPKQTSSSDSKKSTKNTTQSAPKASHQEAPTSPAAPAADHSADLPHTGPSDVLISIVAAGCLTAAFMMYARSRRIIQPL